MKIEEIKIRVSPNIKKDFQDICETEDTTMSNKLSKYIANEIRIKKVAESDGKAITRKLIRFGFMTSEGRLYSKEDFLRTQYDEDGVEFTEMDKLRKEPVYGQYKHPDTSDKVHKYNATHSISNFRIEDDWLVGDLTVLNPSILPILDNCIVRQRGFGNINDKGVINGLEVISFDLVLKHEDNFCEFTNV